MTVVLNFGFGRVFRIEVASTNRTSCVFLVFFLLLFSDVDFLGIVHFIKDVLSDFIHCWTKFLHTIFDSWRPGEVLDCTRDNPNCRFPIGIYRAYKGLEQGLCRVVQGLYRRMEKKMETSILCEVWL